MRDFPAILENAKKSGDDQTAKIAAGQIEWAKTVKVEEIPAPIMTFDSELRIHMGDETIQVGHLPPAHTDCDSVVYFEKARVLHAGDDGFNRVVPVIDIKAGGSVKGYLLALDKLVARVPADAVVIPGHGEVTDVPGLKPLRQYIVDLLEAAQKARAAGKSREEFVKPWNCRLTRNGRAIPSASGTMPDPPTTRLAEKTLQRSETAASAIRQRSASRAVAFARFAAMGMGTPSYIARTFYKGHKPPQGGRVARERLLPWPALPVSGQP